MSFRNEIKLNQGDSKAVDHSNDLKIPVRTYEPWSPRQWKLEIDHLKQKLDNIIHVYQKTKWFFIKENPNITQLKKIRSSLDVSSDLNCAELISFYLKIEDCLELFVQDQKLYKITKKLDLHLKNRERRFTNSLLPDDILTLFYLMDYDNNHDQTFLRSLLTTLRLDPSSPLYANLTFDFIRQGFQIPALGHRLKNSFYLLADKKQNTAVKSASKELVNLGKFNRLFDTLLRETVSFLEPDDVVSLRRTCRSGSAWPTYYKPQINRFFKEASTIPVFVSGPQLALSMKDMFNTLAFSRFQMLPNGNIIGLIPNHFNRFSIFHHFSLCLLDGKTCDSIRVRHINNNFLNIPRDAHFTQVQPGFIHVYLNNSCGSVVWDIENNNALISYKGFFLDMTGQCVQTKKGDLIVSNTTKSDKDTIRPLYFISYSSSDPTSLPTKYLITSSSVANCKFVPLNNGLVAYAAESDPFGTFLFLYNPESKETTQFCKLLDKPIALYPLSNSTFLVRYLSTSKLYVHAREKQVSIFTPMRYEGIEGEIIQSPDLNYFAIHTSIKEPHEERQSRLYILDVNKLQRQVFKLEIGLSQMIGWTQDSLWGVTYDNILYQWPWVGQSLELEHSDVLPATIGLSQ